jgi:hypothetical protein
MKLRNGGGKKSNGEEGKVENGNDWKKLKKEKKEKERKKRKRRKWTRGITGRTKKARHDKMMKRERRLEEKKIGTYAKKRRR